MGKRLCTCGSAECPECAGRGLTPADKKRAALAQACRCGNCPKCEARIRRRELMRKRRAEDKRTPWQKMGLAHICRVVGLRWMIPSTLDPTGYAFRHPAFDSVRRIGPKQVRSGGR